jgi:cytoskeleton protein RodZ
MMAEAHEDVAELPLDPAGVRLRRAREAAGLSRADIAARTKIAERHLASIEEGNFAALASRAYAVGFARSYARVVGLDESVIAKTVRHELGDVIADDERRPAATFEPGDPARVPTARLALISTLVALVLVAAMWLAWRHYNAPGAALPDLSVPPEAAAPSPAPAASQVPAIDRGGAVVFTALQPGIWVKVYDAALGQLMQKELAMGESYTVPAEAKAPMIWTGRPEALQVSIGGTVVPKLSDVQTTIKDMPVTAAALLARQAAVPAIAAPSDAAVAGPAPSVPAQAAAPVARSAPTRTRPANQRQSRDSSRSAAAPASVDPANLVPAQAVPAQASPVPQDSPQASTVSQ